MLENIIYWSKQKKWLLLSLLFSGLLLLFPTPHGLEISGYRIIVIVILFILLILFEPIPLPATGMLIIVLQVLFGIASPNEVASSFMSDSVFFIMGSLMLAIAIISQGLDSRLALAIINVTGHKTWKISFGFILFCALLSSFIGEHTVTAMMMPVGITLIRNTNANPKKNKKLSLLLLFSIAYGSAIGSIGTPSGGGRNVIMIGYLSQFGIAEVTYLEWMKYAYPILILQIPLTVIVLWTTFKPEKMILDSAVIKLKTKVSQSGKLSNKQVLAILIFIFIFFGWIFFSSTLGLGIISLIGVILYLSFGLIEWRDLNKNTNWGVIILFGAAISIGFQMKETGAAFWLANNFIEWVNSFSTNINFSYSLISVIFTSSLTNFLSNAATIAVLGPIVINIGGDSLILPMITALSSAFGYLTIVASPSYMIIYSSGLVKSSDFLKGGWKMMIMSIILLLLFSNIIWPLFL